MALRHWPLASHQTSRKARPRFLLSAPVWRDRARSGAVMRQLVDCLSCSVAISDEARRFRNE